jgi:pimeloyl-ACP methyl ester carboxylesterase
VEFVLVHGSTQSPAGWDRLAAALGTRGHDVRAIDLPPGRPGWTVDDYAREASAQAGEPAGRRVVVGHSGAGVLLPAIADATRASAAVWLAAYVPDLAGGHRMAEDIAAHRDAIFHADWLGVDPTSDPDLATRFLFHDCDEPTRQWALGTLRLFNPGPAVFQHPPSPLPSAITRSSIVPTGDRTLRPDWMREAARERLGVQPAEVSAGHCPHVSQPEVVADILAKT